MRLIDADTICEGMVEGWQTVLIKAQVDNAPTVDAVVVTRCKDCDAWKRNVGIVDSPNGHCFEHDIDTNGQDFFSYGERREE